jgi:hypothetical protein
LFFLPLQEAPSHTHLLCFFSPSALALTLSSTDLKSNRHGFQVSLMDVETTVLNVAKRVLTDGGATSTSTSQTPSSSSPTASNSAALAARGLALEMLARIYASAKTTNLDPYSWREAFAQAAQASAR